MFNRIAISKPQQRSALFDQAGQQLLRTLGGPEALQKAGLQVVSTGMGALQVKAQKPAGEPAWAPGGSGQTTPDGAYVESAGQGKVNLRLTKGQGRMSITVKDIPNVSAAQALQVLQKAMGGGGKPEQAPKPESKPEGESGGDSKPEGGSDSKSSRQRR